jgi:hypothetical protein
MVAPSLCVMRTEGDQSYLTAIRDLSADEHAHCLKATKRLTKWQHEEHPYRALVNAHRQFVTALYTLSRRHERGEPLNGLQVQSEMNERVSQLLHAWRAFLDQSRQTLSSHYGTDSEQVKRFKESCSSEYDGSFSYRFLDQLRNYTQHVGQAVGQVSLASSMGEFGDPSTDRYRLEVSAVRDSLLGWSKLKGAVRKDLDTLPARIPLEPHVNALMQSNHRIHQVAVAQQVPDLLESAQAILSLTGPAVRAAGVPCIFDFDAVMTERGEPRAEAEMRIEWIPADLAQDIVNTMVP